MEKLYSYKDYNKKIKFLMKKLWFKRKTQNKKKKLNSLFKENFKIC